MQNFVVKRTKVHNTPWHCSTFILHSDDCCRYHLKSYGLVLYKYDVPVLISLMIAVDINLNRPNILSVQLFDIFFPVLSESHKTLKTSKTV